MESRAWKVPGEKDDEDDDDESPAMRIGEFVLRNDGGGKEATSRNSADKSTPLNSMPAKETTAETIVKSRISFVGE